MGKQIPWFDKPWDPDVGIAGEQSEDEAAPVDEDNDISYWDNMIFPI